jgi:hypothetical protein
VRLHFLFFESSITFSDSLAVDISTSPAKLIKLRWANSKGIARLISINDIAGLITSGDAWHQKNS